MGSFRKSSVDGKLSFRFALLKSLTGTQCLQSLANKQKLLHLAMPVHATRFLAHQLKMNMTCDANDTVASTFACFPRESVNSEGQRCVLRLAGIIVYQSPRVKLANCNSVSVADERLGPGGLLLLS